VVDVKLFEPQEGRRHLRGALVSVEGGEFCVDEDGAVTRVDFDHVKNARLVHEFPEVGRSAK